jgi:lysophospholipase L1-like esterase
MSERETSVPDRRNEVTRNYGSACREVAAAHDCDVVDVFELLGGNGSDYSQHLSDGVHLSGSGNTLLCNALMQLLYDRYPNLAPMSGDGKNENVGIPMEEALWKDLC